jgi:hypothetical protein
MATQSFGDLAAAVAFLEIKCREDGNTLPSPDDPQPLTRRKYLCVLSNEILGTATGLRDPALLDPVYSRKLRDAAKDAFPVTVPHVLFHYRHGSLPESRAVVTLIDSEPAAALSALAGENPKNVALGRRINELFVDVYFDIIGRSDSLTDCVLRGMVRSDTPLRQVKTLRLSFENEVEALIETTEAGSHLRIRVDQDLRERLLGRGMFPLDREFFTYVRGVATEGLSLRPEEHVRRLQQESLFFEARDAVLGSEAIRTCTDDGIFGALLSLWNVLGLGEWHGSDNPTEEARLRLVVGRRVLAIIQGTCLFSRIAGDSFDFFFAQRKGGQSRAAQGAALPSVLILGGLPENDRDATWAFTAALAGTLKERFEKDASRSLALHPPVSPESAGTLQSIIEAHETLTRESVSVGLSLGLRLLRRRHEGHPVGFRLAVGSDHDLRQGFSVSHSLARGKPGPLRIHFRDGGDAEDVENEIGRFAALVEANYSFLQSPDAYLCLAAGDGGLTIEYVARPRFAMESPVSASSVTPLDGMSRLSGLMPDLLLIAVDGEGWGTAAVAGKTCFSIGPGHEWWIDDHSMQYQAVLERRLSEVMRTLRYGEFAEEHGLFVSLLAATLLRVCRDPKVGATFVLGPWSELEKYAIEMTPVFDVVPEWRVESPILAQHLFNLAIQDGATVVALDQARVFGRRHLSSRLFDPDGEDSQEVKGKKVRASWSERGTRLYWPNWGSWYRWGTRHRSAAALARELRGQAVVLCVSQDGPLHLFHGEKIEEIDLEASITVQATIDAARDVHKSAQH